MDRRAFLELMEFPREWIDWEMLPGDDWFAGAMAEYEPGNEQASEHDRHGAFQWWLRQSPTPDQLVMLARLAWLDPDDVMAASVRSSIAAHPAATSAVDQAVRLPYRSGEA
jgi:hypothetical protein